MRGRETYPVIAAVGGAERELAGWPSFRRHNAVVIVKGFVNRNSDAQVIVYREVIGIALILLGFVVALE